MIQPNTDALSQDDRAILNHRIHSLEIAERREPLLEAIGYECAMAIGTLIAVAISGTGIGKYKIVRGFVEPDGSIVLCFVVPSVKDVPVLVVANALLESHGITRFSVADKQEQRCLFYDVKARGWSIDVMEVA